MDLKYTTQIGLIFTFFLAEIIIGIYANSLSLLTDAIHMLSDLFALIIAYSAYRLSQRKKTVGFTYGWIRAPIIGAVLNGSFLLASCFFIFLQIVDRIILIINQGIRNETLEKNINLVLFIAIGGLVINLIGLVLFGGHGGHEGHGDHDHGHDHAHAHEHSHSQDHENNEDENNEDENNENETIQTNDSQTEEKDLEQQVIDYNNYAVYLHILGDALGSLLVIISSLLIKFVTSDWRFYTDPIASFLIICFIAYSSIKLLRSCIMILLHQTPISLDYDGLIYKIKQIEDVIDVHDVHVWPLNNKVILASLHIKINKVIDQPINLNIDQPINQQHTDQIIGKIKQILHQHGIHASTIQPEYSNNCLEPQCHDQCQTFKCCE